MCRYSTCSLCGLVAFSVTLRVSLYIPSDPPLVIEDFQKYNIFLRPGIRKADLPDFSQEI